MADFHFNKHLPPRGNNDTIAGVKVSTTLSSTRAGTPRSLCLIFTMPFSIHEPAKRSRMSFSEDAWLERLPQYHCLEGQASKVCLPNEQGTKECLIPSSGF